MGVIRGQRRLIQVSLPSASVGDAVADMRQRQSWAGPHLGMRLKVYEDGRVHARLPGGRYHNPPFLRARFEGDAGSVTLKGVIHEAFGEVIVPRIFMALSVFMLAVAIILVVVGNPVPGSIICFIGGILFGLIGYGLGRLRGNSFRIDCNNLMQKVTALLPLSSDSPHRLP
jgi:hypothetical protein